jgi:hypothetical protein
MQKKPSSSKVLTASDKTLTPLRIKQFAWQNRERERERERERDRTRQIYVCQTIPLQKCGERQDKTITPTFLNITCMFHCASHLLKHKQLHTFHKRHEHF